MAIDGQLLIEIKRRTRLLAVGSCQIQAHGHRKYEAQTRQMLVIEENGNLVRSDFLQGPYRIVRARRKTNQST